MRSIGHLDKENAKRRSSWAGEEVSESFLPKWGLRGRKASPFRAGMAPYI